MKKRSFCLPDKWSVFQRNPSLRTGEIPLKRGEGRISFHRERSERFHPRAAPEDFTAAKSRFHPFVYQGKEGFLFLSAAWSIILLTKQRLVEALCLNWMSICRN